MCEAKIQVIDEAGRFSCQKEAHVLDTQLPGLRLWHRAGEQLHHFFWVWAEAMTHLFTDLEKRVNSTELFCVSCFTTLTGCVTVCICVTEGWKGHRVYKSGKKGPRTKLHIVSVGSS